MKKAFSIISFLCWSMVIKVSSLIKASMIFGSKAAFFSLSSITLPVAGKYAGFRFTAFIAATLCFLRWYMTGSVDVHFLAYIIPGLVAAAYLRSGYRLFALVPVLCAVAFLSHSIGNSAWMYTLYWIIPVVLCARSSSSLVAQAFAATFLAHAVGSTIWLYTMPTTAEFWVSLLPMVAVERVLFASGILAADVLLSIVHAFSKSMRFMLKGAHA